VRALRKTDQQLTLCAPLQGRVNLQTPRRVKNQSTNAGGGVHGKIMRKITF
jgi:hypothetical protein